LGYLNPKLSWELKVFGEVCELKRSGISQCLELSTLLQLADICLSSRDNQILFVLEALWGLLSKFVENKSISFRRNLVIRLINDLVNTTSALELINVNHYDIKLN